MSRSYEGPASVGAEYDAWTADGVLEHFWGEHIHHGYYPERRRAGVDFREAKLDLVERLLDWAEVGSVSRALDVGCGIGGSARHLARRFGAEVEGVTLSAAQVERARELTPPEAKARFRVADALELPFDDASFDLVWSCESGEHMPDKPAFFGELVRVLRPRGTLVLATWCRPEGSVKPREAARLERIYREWALPPFIPIETYAALAEADARLEGVRTGDWSPEVAPTWPHQIALGARNLPWLLRQGPKVVWRSLRDARAVRDMIAGYASGAVRYGLLRAGRRAP